MHDCKFSLKCGLEVHQQLDTGKLFCRCPSKMRDDKPDIIIKRKLHASASELGEYDAATVEAFKKGQDFVYELYSDTTCLIEADEEPPKPANKEALETALMVAQMLGSNIVDEVHVMRKTVVDGSNISGFQRTALIALGGKIKISNKEIGIQSVVLEEDAGRTIQRSAKEVVYRLDRLGIPLIEIATEPELNTPEEVRECALAIGTLIRRTCKAKRGLGTIRQDLNISIPGGARVEIKGVQELEAIDEYVRREMMRQKALLEIKNELEKRNLRNDELKNDFVDVSEIFIQCECKITKSALNAKQKIYAVKLPKFKGLLGKEIQPERRFGTELASYLKAKFGIAGLFHSDELPKYGITEKEISAISKKLNLQAEDAFVLVCENDAKAREALEAIVERCKQALIGVPGETRNALPGGNNEYSRPLPGAARMYPETDIKPIVVDKKMLDEIAKKIPKTVEERVTLYKKHGLSEKLIDELKLSNYACLYEELVEKGFNATKTAVLLLEGITALKRDGFDIDNINAQMIESVLKAEKEGKITREAMVNVLGEWTKNTHLNLEQILEKLSLKAVDEESVRKIIASIVERNKELIKKQGERAISALMGEAMKELRGKVSGKMISELLQKEMKRYF